MYLIEMPPHLLFFYMTYQEHTDDVFSDYGQQELHSGVGFLFCVYDEPSADLCLHKDLHLANVHHRAVKRDDVQSIRIELLSEMMYKVYESSRSHPTRL